MVLLLAARGPAPARAEGDAGVDLVGFHGPATPGPAATAARDRLAARARAAGLAWLDLSPKPAPASDAAGRLRAGIDAYDELRWNDAHGALDDAAAEAWRTGAAGLTTAELADVFLYRALVDTQLGDATHAWDDLVRAATIAPARTLDPLRFPTRAVEAFDRARTAAAALPRAVLAIDAPGCASRIDGGEAARLEVIHGEHAVQVACPGRAPWGARVVVAGDLTVTPPPDDARPPDDAAWATVAAERGAAAVLAATVADDGAGATLVLRVVPAHGAPGRRTSIALTGDDHDAAAIDAAVDRVLLAPVTGGPAAATPWWKSRWLWAAAGAAVTAAVIVPLTIGGDRSDGGTVTVRPTGWSTTW
ncbi:MAG: hypothetical protein H6708_10180 [Kofleriaceae bacterium]|nr:hypothetical protein [Kofleriaceae bacterium]